MGFFFDSWTGLLRVLIAGVTAYVGLVVLLRVFGKRTLSKMNAFDLVVTVALGSILAAIITSKGVAIVEGLAAFALLITLQYIVAWSAVRSRKVEQLVKSEPQLLFRRGEYLRQAMKRERVTTDEVLTAIRTSGANDIGDVEAVVLETDGTFTVLQKIETGAKRSSLEDVKGAEPFEEQEGDQA